MYAWPVKSQIKKTDQHLMSRNSDPFQFWKNSSTLLPALSSAALKHLVAVESSVSPERLVSTMNDIICDNRSCLTDQHSKERTF